MGGVRKAKPRRCFATQQDCKSHSAYTRLEITSLLYTLCYNARRGGVRMTNLSEMVMLLKRERDRLQQQVSGLNAALAAFAGVQKGKNNRTNSRSQISAKGRARIAAAQRARWARVKGKNSVTAKPAKRTMSASARRKIAAAQRARWAKVKP